VVGTEPSQHPRTPQRPSLPLTTTVSPHEVLDNSRLAPDVHRLEVRAERVAAAGRPGQFVIVRLGPGAERIPLTIADADVDRGAISLVIQAVGKSTRDLVALPPRERIYDVAGPLGRPSTLVTDGHAVCVAGGVGAAVVHPIARALRHGGATVTTVLGARSRDRVLLAAELAEHGRVVVCTEDGSEGRRGLVTDALPDVLRDGAAVVYAAGPVPMMRAVAELTRPLRIRTIASLNPIMVDGTGMCGGCRVTVGGRMRFACVDGPDFDAHEVDFDELADRLTTYRPFERAALQGREVGL
jgi:ferredoxin/flavodoxin---NADP+ reductase